MQVRVQSFPPLGEVTVVEKGSRLPVAVILQLPNNAAFDQWQVELWVSVDEDTWAPHKAVLRDLASLPFSFVNLNGNKDFVSLYYTATLNFIGSVRFTVRCRPHPQEDWAWAKDVCGLGDAFITLSDSASEISEPPLPGLDTKWSVKERSSQSPGTRLWALGTTVPAVEGSNYPVQKLDLGRPWGHFIRYFSLTRSGAWLNPEHGRDNVDKQWDAVLCSFLHKDGSNLVLLAVSGYNNVRSCLSARDGGLQARIENSSKHDQMATVLVATGQTFDNAVATVMYEARDVMTAMSPKAVDSVAPREDSATTWRESWTDGLGYCTWNSLGQEVTASSLLQALEDLSNNDIHITNLIIDDGWQSIVGNGWTRFEAAQEKFPDGLKATLSLIRDRYPNIEHIAAWHSIIGYWGGIAPHGEIAKSYKTATAQGPMLLLHKDAVASLYDDFYKFLSNAGIDAVKVDNQVALSRLEAANERRDFIYPHLDAWSGAALRHFSYRTISCMSQFEEALFRSQLASNKPTMVARNSEDYFPDPNDTRTHAWHLWANAHNSLFTRYLNVLPDWDMFQTGHEWGHYHAAARCLSGGPVCITDVPGKHNMELIHQIAAITPNGRTVVLRPSSTARSVHQYTHFDETQVLKIGNYHSSSSGGSPMLGVFNITDQPITELISLASFPSVNASLHYVVRSHTTGTISPPVSTSQEQRRPDFCLSLRRTEYDILTAVPLVSLQVRSEEVRVGALGLIDKMTGCAALVDNKASLLENGRILVETSLKALGIFGLWISTLPQLSIDDDFMITILGQPVPRETVSKSKKSEYCLEIDIETAWKEMGLVSQWSNEIGVKVYFRG